VYVKENVFVAPGANRHDRIWGRLSLVRPSRPFLSQSRATTGRRGCRDVRWAHGCMGVLGVHLTPTHLPTERCHTGWVALGRCARCRRPSRARARATRRGKGGSTPWRTRAPCSCRGCPTTRRANPRYAPSPVPVCTMAWVGFAL
jgi:hypothetical protein